METAVSVRRFHKPLADAGIVPENCRLLEMSIGVSIGIAVADAHDSAETVLAKADAAMYRTKNDRREWQGAA